MGSRGRRALACVVRRNVFRSLYHTFPTQQSIRSHVPHRQAGHTPLYHMECSPLRRVTAVGLWCLLQPKRLPNAKRDREARDGETTKPPMCTYLPSFVPQPPRGGLRGLPAGTSVAATAQRLFFFFFPSFFSWVPWINNCSLFSSSGTRCLRLLLHFGVASSAGRVRRNHILVSTNPPSVYQQGKL